MSFWKSGRGGDASTGVEPRIYPTHHKTNQHLLIGLKFGILSNIAKENADTDRPTNQVILDDSEHPYE